jgi:hypothetical protein
MSNPGGTIYAIGAVGTSYVKIGSTRPSVERRMRALQTAQPFSLQVLATVPVEEDLHRIEKQVHAFLATEGRRGEWFNLDIDMGQLEALIVRAIHYLHEEEARKIRVRAAHHAGHRYLEDAFDCGMGTRIRAERERLALSREDLIKLMGDLRMDRNTLWYIEAGRTKTPRADQIIALAKALNVSADYILGLSDEPKPPAQRQRTRKPAPVA